MVGLGHCIIIITSCLLLLAPLPGEEIPTTLRPLWGVRLLGGDTDPVSIDPITGSPAERSGIKAGDIVLRIGNRDVRARTDLLRFVASLPVNKPTFRVIIKRGDQTLELTSRAVFIPNVYDLESIERHLLEQLHRAQDADAAGD